MKLVNDIFIWFLKRRLHRFDRQISHPTETQKDVFDDLISMAKNTVWGQQYGYGSINSYQKFQNQVPVSAYEDLYPFIERVLKGEHNVLWPTEIKWFSKSSGTTNAKSKFIPVSNESLEQCHFQGGKDLISMYIANRPDTQFMKGKGLSIGGSLHDNPFNPNTRAGDVSAVMMKNLPSWAEFLRTPSLETALLDNWDLKVERMIEECLHENVTNALGVPTWVIVLFEKIMEKTGAQNMLEVWPEFEVFFHGAVNFQPYRDLFKTKFFPSSQVSYFESYNASEGYFAIQDDINKMGELMLMLDYGIFYEFVPMEEIDKDHPKTLTLGEVDLDKTYAVLISTNAGLWRYKIGDTVKFTSKNPYRIKIMGRTKQFINAFGEELMVDNAEEAVAYACKQVGAAMLNFTAGPIYMENSSKGAHEWILEFENNDFDHESFIHLLDSKLRDLNSDYDAKRFKDMALLLPKVHFAPQGTFTKWMESRGKLGGQHKVPRLCNSREYLDDILQNILNL